MKQLGTQGRNSDSLRSYLTGMVIEKRIAAFSKQELLTVRRIVFLMIEEPIDKEELWEREIWKL